MTSMKEKIMNFITQASANFISLLFGVAGFLIVMMMYPLIENFVLTKVRERITWTSDTLGKMYVSKLQKKYIIIAVGLGPMLLLAFLGFFFTYSMSGFILVLVISVFGFIGWFLPKVVLGFLYHRRLEKFDEQLIDALGMLSNSIQAGLSLLQGLQVIVKNMPNPIAQEFALVLSEHSLGTTLDDALINLANRVPSEDLGMVVNSITILRETGGNLSETFDTTTNTIRERKKINGKIKAMTSMGIAQGTMMIGFPYVLAFAFYSLNPNGMKLFVTTKLGWLLIIAALILQGIGAYVIKKIVTIDI